MDALASLDQNSRNRSHSSNAELEAALPAVAGLEVQHVLDVVDADQPQHLHPFEHLVVRQPRAEAAARTCASRCLRPRPRVEA